MVSRGTAPPLPTGRPTRLRGTAANLALAGISIALSAAVLEGCAHRIEARWPPPPTAGYIWDWEIEWDGEFPAFQPRTRAWPPEEINAGGFRDRWRTVERLPHAVRVVALGDSVTFGAGVDASEAWPQRLEARLRAEGRRVEVFNAGMIGWSTRQERLAWERILRPYRPDRVLLGVCLNDIPELNYNLGRPPQVLRDLHDRSAAVRLAVGSHRRRIQRVEQLFTRPDSPVTRRALADFFAEVRELRASVEAAGSEFALAVFPFRFQVLPEAPAPTVQAEIARFCRAEGLACLDLLPALAPLGEKGFVDYDHFTLEGAERVATALLDSGLVPLPPSDGEVLVAAGVAADDPRELWRALSAAREPRVRVAAARALRGLGPAAARATAGLATALAEDPDPAVRAESAATLAALNPHAAAAVLLHESLGDPDAAVRHAVTEALAGHPGAASVDLARLVATLDSPDPVVRSFGAWSIGERGPRAGEAAPALVRLLAAERGHGSNGAAASLARVGARSAVPALAAELTDADPARRAEIAVALGELGPLAGPAAASLAGAAADPEPRVRLEAVRALARLGPLSRPAWPALFRAARDADWRVRAEALVALAAAGADAEGSRAREAFARALADPKPSVRAAAAEGLAGLGAAAAPAVPSIAALLDDPQRDVRVAAARSLGELGPVAAPAREKLERAAATDPRQRVRREASRALDRLAR